MSKKISVVIRNKNQEKSLEFALFNLTTRYKEDVEEIIVVDNESTDQSKSIGEKYGVSWVNITDFSYGKSANLAASSANNEIVVIFSAHAFPVSHDFFKLIKQSFENNADLAGVRCIHTERDYKVFINGILPESQPRDAGLLFCGSAFSKSVWEKIPFQDNIVTFEDKDWSVKVLKQGYKIEMVPAIFCYDIKRTPKSFFKRFKDETIGSYNLWGTRVSLGEVVKKLVFEQLGLIKGFVINSYYLMRNIFFLLNFIINKQSWKK